MKLNKHCISAVKMVALVLSFLSANAIAQGVPATWSYSGKTAPDKWAELETANATCKTSKEQSPINIVKSKVAKATLPVLNFSYQAGPAELVNNSHTIQVDFPEGSALKVGANEAALLQFHFHTPSEEEIDGVRYPMVAHFVHKDKEGKLFVVAVLFKLGKENTTLAPLFSTFPAINSSLHVAHFDPAKLLPEKLAYYQFMGSLTTPPCSDGVRWFVLKHPQSISRGQLALFKQLYSMNARPVQPLHGRVVEESE
ncbi:carbonic anhydrase [Undibacterium sp. MH2W]|uniref:carbonic anhydrase n=1 Tax=Undibacterium sp. MH2W TaxID=3413044 RepID=UPI003BF33042